MKHAWTRLILQRRRTTFVPLCHFPFIFYFFVSHFLLADFARPPAGRAHQLVVVEDHVAAACMGLCQDVRIRLQGEDANRCHHHRGRGVQRRQPNQQCPPPPPPLLPTREAGRIVTFCKVEGAGTYDDLIVSSVCC